jgi:hypothetical protein
MAGCNKETVTHRINFEEHELLAKRSKKIKLPFVYSKFTPFSFINFYLLFAISLNFQKSYFYLKVLRAPLIACEGEHEEQKGKTQWTPRNEQCQGNTLKTSEEMTS